MRLRQFFETPSRAQQTNSSDLHQNISTPTAEEFAKLEAELQAAKDEKSHLAARNESLLKQVRASSEKEEEHLEQAIASLRETSEAQRMRRISFTKRSYRRIRALMGTIAKSTQDLDKKSNELDETSTALSKANGDLVDANREIRRRDIDLRKAEIADTRQGDQISRLGTRVGELLTEKEKIEESLRSSCQTRSALEKRIQVLEQERDDERANDQHSSTKISELNRLNIGLQADNLRVKAKLHERHARFVHDNLENDDLKKQVSALKHRVQALEQSAPSTETPSATYELGYPAFKKGDNIENATCAKETVAETKPTNGTKEPVQSHPTASPAVPQRKSLPEFKPTSGGNLIRNPVFEPVSTPISNSASNSVHDPVSGPMPLSTAPNMTDAKREHSEDETQSS